MSHIIGLSAVLVYVLLPGIVLVSGRQARTRLERCGLICAVSIGVNAFAIMVFAVLGAYGLAAAVSWAVCLIGFTICFLVRSLYHGRKPLQPEMPESGTKFPRVQDGKRGWQEQWLHLSVVIILAIQACKTWFFPLYAWDAIASWNRWARNYVVVPNYFQTRRFLYPQYHSWGMSFPYMLSGDPSLEYHSHALSFAYLLVLYAGVCRLARLLDTPGWLAFSMLFVTLPIAFWVGSGYADDAAAAFTTLAIALHIESLQSDSRNAAVSRAGLAGLAAGTAFLFKPSSMPMIVLAPLFCTLLGAARTRPFRSTSGMAMALGMMVIVAPWLLTPQSVLIDSKLAFVLHDIHGSRSRWEILQRGFDTFRSSATILDSRHVDTIALLTMGLLLVIGMVRSSTTLAIGSAGVLAVAIWLNTANYDARALLPAIPVLIVLVASGLTTLVARMGGSVSTGYGVAGVVHVACIALYVIAECFSPLTYAGSRVFDWRPGQRWHTVPLLAAQQDKAASLLPPLGALQQWKRLNPDFAGRFWSDPVLSAAYDPSKRSGGGMWLGKLLDKEGQPRWRPGDVLFVTKSRSFRGDQRHSTRRGDGSGEGSSQTWEEWLSARERLGEVRDDGPFGNYTAYAVLGKRP